MNEWVRRQRINRDDVIFTQRGSCYESASLQKRIDMFILSNVMRARDQPGGNKYW
jgi:hypothetical protein